MKKGKSKSLILGVTGSIAIYKSLNLLRMLIKEKFEVDVIMTKEAQQFITPLTFQSIVKKKVYSDLFELIKENNPLHISLCEKARLILVYPATCNFISKIACGICDDLLSCVIMSFKGKVVFCPASDTNMYLNPIFQENLKKLKKLGYIFLGPVKGELVSGKKGVGHIISEEEVLRKIKNI